MQELCDEIDRGHRWLRLAVERHRQPITKFGGTAASERVTELAASLHDSAQAGPRGWRGGA
jgi:hypothetical protein